jgi:hypothetical protein
VKLAYEHVKLILSNCFVGDRINFKTPWSEYASELFLPSDRRLSAK